MDGRDGMGWDMVRWRVASDDIYMYIYIATGSMNRGNKAITT